MAKCFIQCMLLRHGAPEADTGTAFTSRFMQEAMRLSYTSHRKAAAYNAKTNVLMEGLLKTWDTMLPYVAFATAQQLKRPPIKLFF